MRRLQRLRFDGRSTGARLCIRGH